MHKFRINWLGRYSHILCRLNNRVELNLENQTMTHPKKLLLNSIMGYLIRVSNRPWPWKKWLSVLIIIIILLTMCSDWIRYTFYAIKLNATITVCKPRRERLELFLGDSKRKAISLLIVFHYGCQISSNSSSSHHHQWMFSCLVYWDIYKEGRVRKAPSPFVLAHPSRTAPITCHHPSIHCVTALMGHS